MVRIKDIFKPKKEKGKLTPKGYAGYDNPRENIDPHIKTQAISTREIIGTKLEIKGISTFRGNISLIGTSVFSPQITFGTSGGASLLVGYNNDLIMSGTGSLVARNVKPSEPATFDLGDNVSKWRKAYFSGTIKAGVLQAANGFTGTGAYTNFTISGGIILAAS